VLGKGTNMGKGAKSQRAFLVFLVAAVVNVVPVAATEPSLPLPPEEIAWSTPAVAKGRVFGDPWLAGLPARHRV
jgi:hypothetical protein